MALARTLILAIALVPAFMWRRTQPLAAIVVAICAIASWAYAVYAAELIETPGAFGLAALVAFAGLVLSLKIGFPGHIDARDTAARRARDLARVAVVLAAVAILVGVAFAVIVIGAFATDQS